MSVIVWDGKTLAADRQGTTGGMRTTSTKIKKLSCGAIVAWSGAAENGLELAQWWEDGADPGKWPAYQSADDWTRLIVAQKGQAVVYEKRPVPQVVEDPFGAWGCGRDFAVGALAMGADARAAVKVACQFATGCGMGVDSFLVQDGDSNEQR